MKFKENKNEEKLRRTKQAYTTTHMTMRKKDKIKIAEKIILFEKEWRKMQNAEEQK